MSTVCVLPCSPPVSDEQVGLSVVRMEHGQLQPIPTPLLLTVRCTGSALSGGAWLLYVPIHAPHVWWRNQDCVQSQNGLCPLLSWCAASLTSARPCLTSTSCVCLFALSLCTAPGPKASVRALARKRSPHFDISASLDMHRSVASLESYITRAGLQSAPVDGLAFTASAARSGHVMRRLRALDGCMCMHSQPTAEGAGCVRMHVMSSVRPVTAIHAVCGLRTHVTICAAGLKGYLPKGTFRL